MLLLTSFLLLIVIRGIYPYFDGESRDREEVHDSTIISKHLASHQNNAFLDVGDFERFQEVVLNQQDSFDYLATRSCLTFRDKFLAFLRQGSFIIDSSSKNGFDIYHCANPSINVIFTSFNGFETHCSFWEDQGVGLKFEGNNQYQSLLGRKYSAGFELGFDEYHHTTSIDISIDHRNEGPIEASIVCSLISAKGEEVLWKSLKLPDFESAEGVWRRQAWNVRMPADLTEAKSLRVYIWNKAQTNLEIDKFKISLLSQ
jgi:hypothetical protein